MPIATIGTSIFRNMTEARLDKWLWAVRIFKTRTIATDACRNGRVTVNGQYAKASRIIAEGDKVSVRKPPVVYTFLVLKAITQRVGAAKLAGIVKNITPKEQLEILELQKIGNNGIRARGMGRPTKKDRRKIDNFMYSQDDEDFEIDFLNNSYEENGFDDFFEEQESD